MPGERDRDTDYELEWSDADGDGFDDRTFLPEYAYTQRRDRRRYEAELAAGGNSERDRIDRGEAPRPPPGSPGTPGGPPATPEDNRSAFERADEAEQIVSQIPIVGDGIAARHASADARTEADRMRDEWENVRDELPAANDLWVQYEEEGNVAGPERSEAANVFADQGLIDKQQSALGAFEDIVNSNGITGADRAKLAQGEQEMGRAMRSQRDADMSQLQARGMGGSGAAIQSMLGAQQGGADMLAAREGQMQIEGQRRRDAAIGAMGGMAGGMRDQGFNEGAYRGEAADSFNRYQTDYQRGRNERNTGHRNRTRESRADSRESAARLRMDATAGMSNQWTGSAAGARASKADEDEAKRRQAEAAGGLLEGLASL